MKNKKLLYILVPVNILVWGLIGYRIYVYTNESPEYTFEEGTTDSLSVQTLVTDSFTLLCDYSDPFLGRTGSFFSDFFESSYEEMETDFIESENNPRNNSSNDNKAQTLKWPSLQYGGLVENARSEKKVGIMQINGSKYLVEEKQVYNNVLIRTLFKDSVQLVYSGNPKTIIKR